MADVDVRPFSSLLGDTRFKVKNGQSTAFDSMNAMSDRSVFSCSLVQINSSLEISSKSELVRLANLGINLE